MPRAARSTKKTKTKAGPAKRSKKAVPAKPPSRSPSALLSNEERYALALSSINESVYDWNIETGEI